MVIVVVVVDDTEGEGEVSTVVVVVDDTVGVEVEMFAVADIHSNLSAFDYSSFAGYNRVKN